jgi:diguanylate cyclase (GGDEF)-like protein
MTVRLPVRSDAWLLRFGPEVPVCARELFEAVRRCATEGDGSSDLPRSAQALGVLRAQQGHAVAGLTEDLLALRGEAASCEAGHRLIDLALRLAISAYVDELTAVLASRATRDPLTGLPNRAAFDEALVHEIAGRGRAAMPALLLVDLDRFKLVNDTDGHLAGDAVLVAVAVLLSQSARPSDVVCRLGGDEFAVVLPRTSRDRGVQVAHRLLAASRRATGLASPNARVTLSMGVGWLEHPQEPADLVALADQALYAAKAAGGDDVSTSGRELERA